MSDERPRGKGDREGGRKREREGKSAAIKRRLEATSGK